MIATCPHCNKEMKVPNISPMCVPSPPFKCEHCEGYSSILPTAEGFAFGAGFMIMGFFLIWAGISLSDSFLAQVPGFVCVMLGVGIAWNRSKLVPAKTPRSTLMFTGAAVGIVASILFLGTGV